MKNSAGRILTSHTGSLPRPDDLAQMLLDAGDGKPVDRAALAARGAAAVKDAVQKQAEAGIDVVSDGEQSKPGFVNYVRDRMTGFSGQEKPFLAADLLDFPEIAAARPGG